MATTDEIGQRCGMLQVIERLRGSRFRCRCDCGNERIVNTGIYEPKNCRWASREENQRNRKNSRVWLVNGIEFSSLKDAAEHLGVSTATVRAWCGGRWAEGRWYPPKVGFSWRWKYGEGHDSD